MKSEATNRVNADLQHWRELEKRLLQSDAGSILKSPVFLRDKLDYYRGIAARYRNNTNQEEKLYLRSAARERQELERLLYSNPIVRWLYLLTIAPLKMYQSFRTQDRQAVNDEQSLKESLVRAGFGGIDAKLDQHLKQGHREFTIPVSYFMNEKSRMDYELSFGPGRSGQIEFLHYRASLRDDSNPDANRERQFKVEPGGVTAQQSYHLLSGRSVKAEYTSAEGQPASTWLKLDFNDTDANGNYRIRQLAPRYDFDVRQALQKYPIKELESPQSEAAAIRALEDGERYPATLVSSGKEMAVFIEANPRMKSVDFYDYNSDKVTVLTALKKGEGEKQQQIAKGFVMNQNQTQGRKKGHRNKLSIS